jgi:equilibrative nucleoside transporter 1/2/3
VFINSSDYFSFRFQGTSYQNNFEVSPSSSAIFPTCRSKKCSQNFFGICFNVSNVFSLAYATKYGNNISMFNKVVIPLLVQALVFSITTAIVLVPPASISGMTVFAITIPTCLVSGLLTALLQGGTFGLAARFPPKYSQAVMAGQGLGGAGVSLAKLATLLGAAANSNAATYKDLRMSNFTYFLIASLFSFVSVAAYLMLDKLPFAKYYCTGMALSSEEKKEPLLDDGGTDGDSGGEISTEKLREIYGKIKDKMIAVLLVFWVTLAVFPSVTVHIQSMHNYDDPSKDLSFSPDGNGAGNNSIVTTSTRAHHTRHPHSLPIPYAPPSHAH